MLFSARKLARLLTRFGRDRSAGIVGAVGFAGLAEAELIQIPYHANGLLADGSMQIILKDGRGFIANPQEYTFLGGDLYVDSATVARIGFVSGAATQSQGFLGNMWGLVSSPPAMLGGSAVLAGAGVFGLSDIFAIDLDEDDEEDEFVLEAAGTIPSKTVSDGTPSGTVLVDGLDSFFEDIEGTLTHSINVTNSSGQTVTNVIGLVGGQISTIADATDNLGGLYTVTLTAIDSEDGDTATQSFSVLFEANDDDPEVDQGVSNQTVQEGSAFAYTIPSNAFKDEEGAVSLSVSTLPTGLTFDGFTGTISGTPTVAGTTSVTVTATDSAGQTVTDTFDLVVTNVNDAPVFIDGTTGTFTFDEQPDGSTVANGEPVVVQLATLISDEEGDALTFSAPNNDVPAGFALTSGGVFSGIAGAADQSFAIEVSDGNGGLLSFTFELDVA